MILSYFPGCTLKNKAKDLDMYARKCAEALGITLEEIENWDVATAAKYLSRAEWILHNINGVPFKDEGNYNEEYYV